MCFVTNEELVKNGIRLDTFDYHGLSHDLARIYSSYENKFKKLFTDYSEVYNLKNCHFFIKNSNSCNASATTHNGFNIISITNGFPILMERKFNDDFFKSIVLVGLLNDTKISDAYVDLYEDPTFDIKNFILECSVNFTFHHEFRHILQLNSSHLPKNLSHNENLETDQFNLTRHAREFDADRIAAFEVLKYIFSVNRQFSSRTEEKFTCLLYLGLASIIITKNLFYFNIINQIENNTTIYAQPFYTEKYSHPHPLVRIFNIFDYFRSCANDDFPKLNMELQPALNNILYINKLYFDSITKNSNVMKLFFSELRKFSEEIHSYNNKLYDAAINDASIKTLLNRSGININS
jgi:hypothetical protein